jgi:hypothetical protein
VLAQADSWRRLIDADHYFEFLDFKDKKFVLDFLWVMVRHSTYFAADTVPILLLTPALQVTVHRVRVNLISTLSVALLAPANTSPLAQMLQQVPNLSSCYLICARTN